LASAGAVASILLVSIQAFILEQFCAFCVISAGIMITLWLSLRYQQQRTSLARFISLAPILAALVFFLLLMPYVNGSEQPETTVDTFHADGVSQRMDQKETEMIQDSDQTATTGEAEEAIAPDTAAGLQGTEDLSEGQIDDIKGGGETNDPNTDSAAESNSANITQAVDSDSGTLTTFYRADGRPVTVDLDKDYILFFASHCEVCKLALDKVELMPEQERPIIIDIWIPGDANLDDEKQVVQEKFADYSMDPLTVIYDLDQVNPVSKVPRFVNSKI